MGLAWQQGPLAPGAIGTFLTSQPLPERLLFAEPLRRRMRAISFGSGSNGWVSISNFPASDGWSSAAMATGSAASGAMLC